VLDGAGGVVRVGERLRDCCLTECSPRDQNLMRGWRLRARTRALVAAIVLPATRSFIVRASVRQDFPGFLGTLSVRNAGVLALTGASRALSCAIARFQRFRIRLGPEARRVNA
jgi:hypothetical protein